MFFATNTESRGTTGRDGNRQSANTSYYVRANPVGLALRSYFGLLERLCIAASLTGHTLCGNSKSIPSRLVLFASPPLSVVYCCQGIETWQICTGPKNEGWITAGFNFKVIGGNNKIFCHLQSLHQTSRSLKAVWKSLMMLSNVLTCINLNKWDWHTLSCYHPTLYTYFSILNQHLFC